MVQNSIKLVAIEKSRHELFTSGNTNLSVYVILTPCLRDIFRY